MLMNLEDVYKQFGRLPDTIFIQVISIQFIINVKLMTLLSHQIDGGKENTARAVFGICELIVARRYALICILC